MGAPQHGGVFVSISPNVSQLFFGAQATIFTANGALYVVAQTIGSGGANINGTAIYKSTNGGTVWTQMDAAHAPTAAAGAVFFDSANNKLTLGMVTVTFPQTAKPIFLKDFNFSTDTWGANYATGGPNATTSTMYTFKRPDSSIFVIYDFGSSNPGGTTRLRGAYWNGSAWSSSIDIGANTLGLLASGNIAVTACVAAMDPTGNIHVAFTSANKTTFQYYQQVNTSNALMAGVQLTIPGLVTSNAVFGSLVISGSNVLISCVTTSSQNNTVLIGTPLSAPVFSTASPAALNSPTGKIARPGPIATDGTNLIWMVNIFDASGYDTYQLARSSDNGATWSLLSDNSTAPYFYDYNPTSGSPIDPNSDDLDFGSDTPTLAILAVGSGPATAYGFNSVSNTAAAFVLSTYFLNSEAVGAAPSPTPTKFEITLFGSKRYQKPAEVVCTEAPPEKHVRWWKGDGCP